MYGRLRYTDQVNMNFQVFWIRHCHNNRSGEMHLMHLVHKGALSALRPHLASLYVLVLINISNIVHSGSGYIICIQAGPVPYPAPPFCWFCGCVLTSSNTQVCHRDSRCVHIFCHIVTITRKKCAYAAFTWLMSLHL